MNRYDANKQFAVAARASRAVEAYLRGLPKTVRVENVEADPAWQAADVDLLWSVKGRSAPYRVEVKGDEKEQYGNFFLETVSNEERGTPGCFLYTEADYVFYLFLNTGALYVLPMPETREWFLANIGRFAEARTTTPVGGGQHYTTVGRKAPIRTLMAEVPRAKEIRIDG